MIASPSLPPRRPRTSLLRQHLTRGLCVSLSASLLLPMLGIPTAWAQQATQTAPARFRGEPVTLNFVNADIEGVTRALATILKQQFLVDPRVKGTMTLFSEQPLTPNAAYLSYLAALRGLGFTVVEVGGLYKVVPEADAKLQSGTVSIGDVSRRGDQVITQIFRLNHENANNLVPVLRPLISPNNTINANPSNNTLVITDYADNLQRMAKIIAAMDVPSASDVEVVPLEFAVASDLAPMIQKLTDPTSGVAQNLPGSGTATVLVDTRSNSLIVRAPSPPRMAAIRSLVAKLDRPLSGASATGNIWVVYLKNADAVKIATLLRAAFSSAGGGGGASGSSSSSPMASTVNQPNTQSGSTGASPQATSPVVASAGPSTGGFVQADPATNSLIITAPEPLYRQLRAAIDRLDSRRAQVYIESMIVEVNGDNAADFGFQWQGLLGNSGDKYGIIGGTNFNAGNSSGNNIVSITSATTGAGTGTSTGAAGLSLGQGLNIGLVRNYGGTYALAAIARALASTTSTNILSTPNLVTLDNEEAKIVVGQNVPFITGQYTNTGTATTSPFQTIERKDVGITLRIKPQIGENGTVRMVIFQESSSVADTAAVGTGSAGPTTNKRSIESTIVVDDGQIIVLGGLIEDSFSSTRSKIPLLGDLPYVGGLFRSESRTRKKTNLMVFLRPVVMRDQADASKLSLDRYDYIRTEQQGAQPAQSAIIGINNSPVVPNLPPTQPNLGPNPAPPPPLGADNLPVVEGAKPAPAPAPAPVSPAPAPN